MQNIVNLGETNSIFNQYISEIRNVSIQQDRMRFRKNMERIGEIFAYEISKTLSYAQKNIVTPLGEVSINLIQEQPVLATILRAGLVMHQGFLNIFDSADNAFVSAYRKHHKDLTFEIQLDYISAPSLDGRNLILIDPMLATGKSLVLTYNSLLQYGKPLYIHFVCAIASIQGIEYITKSIKSKNYTFWTGAIDPELTAKAYIVPGLGDAGDLAYGAKK